MNQLSKSEFLTRLARTAPTWSVTSQGMLRDGQGRCPVVAVAEEVYHVRADGPTAYRRVADVIGLPAAIAEEVVFAADHPEPRLPIRDRLLEACRAHDRPSGAEPGYSEWWWDQPMSVRAQWSADSGRQEPLPFDGGPATEATVPAELEDMELEAA
jgi:hypothetical protein